MAKDPVCNREFNEQEAPATIQYRGQRYYFCSKTCREAFKMDPQRFVNSFANARSA